MAWCAAFSDVLGPLTLPDTFYLKYFLIQQVWVVLVTFNSAFQKMCLMKVIIIFLRIIKIKFVQVYETFTIMPKT